jgi:hypothetical protein
MNNRKLKFLAILLLSITIIVPAELSRVSSTSTNGIHINSTTASSPGQQILLGGQVGLYFGDISISSSQVRLALSQNPTTQITGGDIIYSSNLPAYYISSYTEITVSNTTYGWWRLQDNWINGTIPRDISIGNYYIKLVDVDTNQVVAVTDTYITAVVSGIMQVTPSSGAGGVNVQFMGSGFSPNQPVTISYYDPRQKTWNYWETQTSNSTGGLLFTKEIPDLGVSGSLGDISESTKPLSFKAYGNGTIAFADYYQYLRGLKSVGGRTASGLFGNNSDLTSEIVVRVGNNVSISGKYFHPNDVIYFRWDGPNELGTVGDAVWSTAEIVGTSIANSTGGFSGNIVVPTCSIGQHYIDVGDSQCKVITKITVTNSTTLNLSPTTGPGGIPVQLTGYAFPAYSTVDIMYLDSALGTWKFLVSLTANPSGQISYNFTVPDLGLVFGDGDYSDTTASLSFRAQINGIIYSTVDYNQYQRGIKTVGNYTASGLFGNGTNLCENVRVNVGDQITISGKWFHPRDAIYARWDGVNIVGTVTGDEWNSAQIIGSSIANSSGGFSLQATIPSAAVGEHYIAIEDSSCKIIIKVLFSPGIISITPSSGPGGKDVTISGQGYPPSTPVTLEYNDPQSNSSWSSFMTNNSDASGRIVFSFTVPDLRMYASSGDSGYEPTYASNYRVLVNGSMYGSVTYTQYIRGLKIVGSQTATGLYGNGTSFTSTVQLTSGNTLRISGKYFHPGTVYIRWDGQAVVGTVTANQWSQTTPMGSTIANSQGYFDTTVTIPPADAGSHYISIEDSQAREIISIWITQTISPTPTPTATPQPTPTQSTSPTPTAQPTATPTPTPNNKPTPTINLSCRSSTVNNGFRVEINGLLSNGVSALSNKAVQLYYSKDGGSNWQTLTLVNTGGDGKFNAVWISSASGVFILKAESPASSEYNQATAVVNLAIEATSGNNEESVFTVTSNSTITQLDFKSETSELSFVASGETGTHGYVTVNIPKTLISDISTLRVYLDNNEVTFTSAQDSDAWIITINYSHSTHNIVMDLSNTQNQSNQQSIPWTIIGAGVATAIIVIVATVSLLKKKQPKAKFDAV